MEGQLLVRGIIGSLLFTGVGLIAFIVAYKVIEKVMPFSLRKELEEDQNVAVGVLMGAMMLGLAIIIAAAIHG